jgi:ABC-type nitrate/sulfonate/bicarbonate transport system permease component
MGRWGTSRLFKLSTQVTVFVCAIVLWELASLTGLLSRNSFPSAIDIGSKLWELVQSSYLWTAVGLTFQGWAMGVATGSVLAILVGTLLGRSRFAYASVIPVVEFLKTVPTIAILPLVIVVLGPTMQMKVFLVTWGIFWALTIQVIYGVRAVDPVVRDNARILQLRGWRLFTTVTLPSAAPYVATGMRVAAAVGLILAVIAEMIGGAAGLGLNILIAVNAGPTELPAMYVYILMTGLVGIAVTALFTILERRALHWHESQRNLREVGA